MKNQETVKNQRSENFWWNSFVRFQTSANLNAFAYGTTLLRIALGTVFIAHALLKLLVFTLPGTADFFEAHGFPGWTAYPVFAGELIGGIFLLTGFLTRLTAIALVPIMIGAFLTHYPNGWSFTNSGGGWEYVAFLLVMLPVQILLGGGAFSLDAVFFTKSMSPQTTTRNVFNDLPETIEN